MTEAHHPIMFSLIFLGGAIGGLTALLRSEKRALTPRAIAASCLFSGLLSLIISLVWWKNYSDANLYFLVGLSILAGLVPDTSIAWLRRKFFTNGNGRDPNGTTNGHRNP